MRRGFGENKNKKSTKSNSNFYKKLIEKAFCPKKQQNF